MFGPENWVRSVVAESGVLPQPALVRTETAGCSYAIDNEMVHYVKTAADTFSIIVQGPRLKETALRVRQGQIVWKGGRAMESAAAVSAVLTTPERITAISNLAHSLRLVSSPVR
jgi:hypothetical protein